MFEKTTLNPDRQLADLYEGLKAFKKVIFFHTISCHRYQGQVQLLMFFYLKFKKLNRKSNNSVGSVYTLNDFTYSLENEVFLQPFAIFNFEQSSSKHSKHHSAHTVGGTGSKYLTSVVNTQL